MHSQQDPGKKRLWTVTSSFLPDLLPVKDDTDRRKGTLRQMCYDAHAAIARAMLCALVLDHMGIAPLALYHPARSV